MGAILLLIGSNSVSRRRVLGLPALPNSFHDGTLMALISTLPPLLPPQFMNAAWYLHLKVGTGWAALVLS